MSNTTVTYAIPAGAIRVFCGFPNAHLSEAQFFAQLGQTFMPGTPYMLQPLGLAAYLPGVLSNPPAGLPSEFALICYPSQTVWSHAMTGTLRGRVYNQTHGGVYAAPPSGAAFPVFVDNLPVLAADPYFLYSVKTDWQTGTTHVIAGAKSAVAQSGSEFRTALRATLLENRSALQNAGVDQVIVTARDAFAIIWIHGPAADLPENVTSFLWNVITNVVVMRHERTVCIDEPPTLPINGTMAFNFVFLRDNKYFQE